MYIRLGVKEGATLINLARVSQIYLRGATLHIQVGSSVKVNSIFFNPDIQTYTYETEKAAQEVFDEIHEFIKSRSSQQLKWCL